MRVLFLGEPDDGISVTSQHARALAGSGVEAQFADGPLTSTGRVRADLIHVVTYEQTDFQLLRRLSLARMVGTPIVRFWTGRDVLWAERYAPSRRFALALARMGATQLARTAEQVARLERLGIIALVGPTLSPGVLSTHEPEPLPGVFTVLCHLPARRRESSGGAVVDRLIERLGNVRFLVLGDTETSYAARKNVEALGVVEEASRAIQRSSVLVQPRVDGGLSRLSLEVLCHGRHVISKHAMPHCTEAGSVESFFVAIRSLERDLGFNLPGREYVCEHFATPRVTRDLHSLLESCADPGDADRRGGRRWTGALGALSQAGVMRSKRFALPEPESLAVDDPFRALVADATREHLSRPLEVVVP